MQDYQSIYAYSRVMHEDELHVKRPFTGTVSYGERISGFN